MQRRVQSVRVGVSSAAPCTCKQHDTRARRTATRAHTRARAHTHGRPSYPCTQPPSSMHRDVTRAWQFLLLTGRDVTDGPKRAFIEKLLWTTIYDYQLKLTYVVFWLLSRMLNWINVTRKTLLSSCASCFLNTIYGSTGITVNEICLHKFIDGMPGFDELCEFQILPLLGIHWCLNALWKCREDRRPGRRFTSAWQLKIYTTITITNHVNCNYSVIVITL